MIVLHTPVQGAEVALHKRVHEAFLSGEVVPDAAGTVDWLHLRREGEDQSAPAAVEFTFSPALEGWVDVSRTADFASCRSFPAVEGGAQGYNFLPGTAYFWRVRTAREISVTGRFITSPALPRMLAVEGISNVRDCGGWPVYRAGRQTGRVRFGRIFRTSEFDRHVQITEAGRQELAALGIRTDLDIRGAGEDPRPVLDPTRVRYVNIPLSAYAEVFTPEQQAAYRRTAEVLCERPYPLAVHCWGGIDRTGTWLFLLGALLGMAERDLFLDYEWSSLSLWGPRSHQSAQFQAFLTELAVYGTDVNTAAERFFSACGVTAEEVAQIRGELTEPC